MFVSSQSHISHTAHVHWHYGPEYDVSSLFDIFISFFLCSPSTISVFCIFFFNDTATTEISTLSLHDALPISIMCMGVATANSVLVVSFARERLEELGDPVAAALEAGFVRFRPVLMTALAMVIGMAPMALGLGQGGEQNAPLGRAVIGGLTPATVATLIFVPVGFRIAHPN